MRVLIGYDGSPSAEQACDLAATTLWPAGSELRVLTAYVPYAPGSFYPGLVLDPATAEAVFADEQTIAEEHLAAATKRIGRPDLSVTSVARTGRPASTILDEATAWSADLLLVGNRGLGPFRSALLGSVSDELVDHAPCPVLVVRGSSLERVVLAEDGSAGARAAASLLAWPIFRASHVRVVTVSEALRHAVEGPSAPPPDPAIAATALRLRDPLTAKGRAWATDLAQATADQLTSMGLATDTDVREGDPAGEIVQSASDWQADLIVMGTRGRTGLERLVRGSVARNVLQQAHCSVLIEREARPAG